MEFTGEYYLCKHCGYIWDFNDICPCCGNDKEIDTLNASEVLEHSKMRCEDETGRLINMLYKHGDYNPF
jgi:hypothetical protein